MKSPVLYLYQCPCKKGTDTVHHYRALRVEAFGLIGLDSQSKYQDALHFADAMQSTNVGGAYQPLWSLCGTTVNKLRIEGTQGVAQTCYCGSRSHFRIRHHLCKASKLDRHGCLCSLFHIGTGRLEYSLLCMDAFEAWRGCGNATRVSVNHPDWNAINDFIR